MKVKAIKKGTWPANRERAVGEAFDYDGPTQKEVDGKKVAYFPSWMEKVEQSKSSKAERNEGETSPAA